jgi:hypothetical protein
LKCVQVRCEKESSGFAGLSVDAGPSTTSLAVKLQETSLRMTDYWSCFGKQEQEQRQQQRQMQQQAQQQVQQQMQMRGFFASLRMTGFGVAEER